MVREAGVFGREHEEGEPARGVRASLWEMNPLARNQLNGPLKYDPSHSRVTARKWVVIQLGNFWIRMIVMNNDICAGSFLRSWVHRRVKRSLSMGAIPFKTDFLGVSRSV